jgi:Flavin-binding monooxygenase-like
MYAVIGAGPMGLACARNLQKLGIPFRGYDRHTGPGGLWDIDNPHSTLYQSAHLISSRHMTEFAEFPMPAGPAYPHHTELRQYFRDYATHFGLSARYSWSTRVEQVAPLPDGRWAVTTVPEPARPEPGQDACASVGELRTTTVHDGVLIASGVLHHPHWPTLPGTFTGRVMHSAEYRTPDVFEGQRVLVVGCGNSGADIAVDAVHRAARVDLSVRRGYYFLPKFIMGRPTDTLGGAIRLPRALKQRLDALLVRVVMGKPSNYGLPDPDYRMYEAHPVINSLVLHHLGQGDITPRGALRAIDGRTVTFADGASAEYDVLLLATGYQPKFPFIDAALLNWDTGPAPRLFLNTFHPQHDTLFLMGMLEAAGLGWEGRNRQAELVALYIRQLTAGAASARALQARKRQVDSPEVRGGYRYLQLDRMAYYVHKESYLRTVQREIGRLRADLAPGAGAA